MKKLIIILNIIVLTGCINVNYENSVIIDAPKDIVFQILEDYENYPKGTSKNPLANNVKI